VGEKESVRENQEKLFFARKGNSTLRLESMESGERGGDLVKTFPCAGNRKIHPVMPTGTDRQFIGGGKGQTG